MAVPKNRQHIPRDERTADLLRVATAVFAAKGYSATTMSDISEAAGVARANIYWYYSSKDDIFAAVMSQLYGREIEQLNERYAGLDAFTILTMALKDLFPYRALHLEMHQRIAYSQAVRDAHDTFMGWIRELVYDVVDQSDIDTDKTLLADVIVATFEGARAPSETRPANELIPFILSAVLDIDRPGPDRPPSPLTPAETAVVSS